MGKVSASCTNPGDSEQTSQERIKKKKRKKDLEELRRNALAAKRRLRSRTASLQTTNTSFMKTLNQFASKRKEIESAIQCQDSLIIKPKIISDQTLPKPLNTKGFFRAGIKGKLLTRPLRSDDKLRNAILNNDALQLMQSGGFRYSKPNESKKISEDGVNLEMKIEIANILHDFSESSSGLDNPTSVEQREKSSPIDGIRTFRKKVNQVKLEADRKLNNIPQQIQSPVTKHIVKEEKCKRRLFEEKNASVNSENTNNYNIDAIRFSPKNSRKSTPENVIFFTEHVPLKDKDSILNKKINNHKIKPLDPQLIKCYVETCKIIAEKDLKDIFWDILEDPLETAKAALKNTYANSFKDYLRKQRETSSEQGSHSTDRTTISSGSEIMLEPDSAIARTLKKNTELQKKNIMWFSKSNSDLSATNLDDIETDFYPLDTTENNPMKRKRILSSKGEHSEIEIASSTKANVDPKSVRIEPKVDSIRSERQNLIDRYLSDVANKNAHKKHEKEKHLFLNEQKNATRECNGHHIEKEKLFISDKGTYLIHKSTKHVPAILRKNRSLVDCVEKEKIFLNIEKSQKSGNVINKSLMQDFKIDNNLKSERTPNCGNGIPNQLMEAPKCKYMYMNAKYNQPSRINVPLMQRTSVPERHLFLSPNNVDKNFVLTQHLELSPIKQQSDLPETKDDFQRYLSQEYSDQESDYMPRIASFGEIQEKTNRLTLRSSQSQNCSQESIKQIHSSQEERCKSHPDFSYRQCKPCNNHMLYNNQPFVTFNDIPTSKTISMGSNSNYNSYTHNAVKHREKPTFISNNDFQIIPSKDYSFQGSDNFNHYLVNDYQPYRKQNPQLHHQESLINYVPMQQQNVCQPIKFLAIEGNRIPQRRPIYGVDDSSFAHTYKPVPNQQSSRIINPSYQRDTSSQPCYTMSSMRYHTQGLQQSIASSDFEYANVQNVNNMIPSNVQMSSNFNNDVPVLSRNTVNFVPSSMSDQTFIAQPSVPLHAAVNQRYTGQQVRMQMPSPLYSQDGYPHATAIRNNEDYRINDVYLHQMNRDIYSKRS